jgi:uncharacterized DUF497 family protein
MQFEWDDNKNQTNIEKHGFDLIIGALVWHDKSRIVAPDNRKDYGEDRFNCIGITEYGILTVCYTMRGENIRIISARFASRKERRFYNDNSKNDS